MKLRKKATKKKVAARVRLLALPPNLYPILASGAAHAGVSEKVALAVVVGMAFAVFEQHKLNEEASKS